MAGLEGRTLDRYELRELLGRGGMADVYLGYDSRFDREVAVKVFKRDDEDLLRRFIREAQLMASLSNPHLIPVYNAGTALLDGINVYYIAMPYMDGGTLRALIRQEGPLPLADASRYLGEIADALDYIHRQGIIHRDIKSSNVLLDAKGRCYLADFGIARALTDSTQMTSTGNVLGTVDYIAPELFETDQRADARSDLYSLGVLLFEMVTGRLPFSAESQIAVVAMHVNKRPPSPRNLVPSLPLNVERVIYRALEKRPEARYPSATELADAFRRAVEDRSLPTDFPKGVWEQSTRVVTPTPVQPQPVYTAQSKPVYLPPPVARPAPLEYSTQNYPVNRITQQAIPAGYSSSSSVGNRQPRTRSAIVIIMAILTVLVISGLIVYAVVVHPGNGQPLTSQPPVATQPGPDLTGTAQVQANANATASAQAATGSATASAVNGATATAQAKASATAQAVNAAATAMAGATVTAQAQASATAGVIQTATAGQADYSDALNNAAAAETQAATWDAGGLQTNCTFKSDGYHVTTGTSLTGGGTLKGCHEAAKAYTNFALKVDMTLLSGHSGGVFFHLTTNSVGAYAGYLFEVSGDGQYKISSSTNFSTHMTTLQEWTTAATLQKGANAKNILQIIARANKLQFYANGVFLIALQDDTFATGAIGLLATTADHGSDADVVYSNLNVYAFQ